MRTALERKVKQRKKLRALIARKRSEAYAKGVRDTQSRIANAIWKEVVVRNLKYTISPLDEYRKGLQKAHLIAEKKGNR